MTTPNLHKLHNELAAAGLPIQGIDSELTITWAAGHPTDTEASEAAAIIAAHDPIEYTITPDTVFVRANDQHSAILVFSADNPSDPSQIPDEINALINAVPQPVPLVDGIGELEITCDTPGAVIVVSVQESPGHSCTIYAL